MVLGLKEGLVECGTVCGKSVVILTNMLLNYLEIIPGHLYDIHIFVFIILGCNSKSSNQTDKADARNCDEWSDISESEVINVDDLSSFSESENDEIISDDWSDISDVAVEIETPKKGKKNQIW